MKKGENERTGMSVSEDTHANLVILPRADSTFILNMCSCAHTVYFRNAFVLSFNCGEKKR